MNSIIQWDTQLFLFLNNLGNSFWDPFWLVISGVKIWIPFYAFLIFVLFRQFNWKLAIVAVLLAVFNVFCTDTGSVVIFKETFMRLRPCHVPAIEAQMRLVKEGCGGMYGFVSSHAANTFGLAVLMGSVLRRKIPYLIFILLGWAALVSYSRIYLGVHYPLDIFCGALYGCLCGYINFNIFKRIKKSIK